MLRGLLPRTSLGADADSDFHQKHSAVYRARHPSPVLRLYRSVRFPLPSAAERLTALVIPHFLNHLTGVFREIDTDFCGADPFLGR